MRRLLPLLLAATGCIDLELPEPPGPGSIQGTLVYFRPGRATPVPAVGAKAQVRKTSLIATANADGYFSLSPISQTEGELLVTLDLDDDGRPDRQRLFDLAELRSGPGRSVSLGQVTLGLNATAVGKALRADVTTRGGHGVTGVLVPEGPYATTTADDGSYLLPDLPEGPVTVAFFREGYELVVVETSVRAGEEVRLRDVRLERATMTTSGAISGRVVLAEGGAAEGALVSVARAGVQTQQVTVGADGAFRLSGLAAGPWDLAAVQTGRVTVLVRNVLVAGADTAIGDLVLSAGLSVPPDFTRPDGGSQPDAGTSDDAGTMNDAGVVPDAGPMDAGDVDAGGPPIARISPPIIPVAIDPMLDGGIVSFVVNADLSTGVPPLRYQWESLNGGEGLVWTPASEFSSRAEFSFSAAIAVRTYGIRLFVTDARGRQSDWTEAEVRAAYRPIAALTPSAAQAGGALVLSSAGSVDPGGLPLTRRYFVVSGAATVMGNGDQATVTALAPGRVVVACEVENSFGLVSDRATSTIDFALSGDAGLQLDAGPNQTVDAGALVALSGSVLGSVPASVQWLEAPPAPMPAIALTDATTFTPSFVAPLVVNGNQVRRFRMEVRAPPNCLGAPPACQTYTAETAVEIVDRSGPRVNFSVGTAMPLSRFRSIVVDFDEPTTIPDGGLTVSTVSPVAVLPSTVVQESATRFRLISQLPLIADVEHEVTLAPVADSRGNASPAQAQRFFARRPVVTAISSATVGTTPTPPRIGATIVPARPLGPPVPTLVVAVRSDDVANQAVFFRPQPVTAPFALMFDPGAPSVTGLSGSLGTRRLITVGSKVFAALEVNAGSWSGTVNDGALVSIDLEGLNPQWIRHRQQGTPPMMGPWTTSMPGPVFTDGASLFSIAPTVTNGVRVARFNQPAGWPDVATGASAEQLNMVALQPGLVRAAGFTQDGVRGIAFFEDATRTLTLWRSPGIGTAWAASNSTTTFPTGAVPKAMRFAVSSSSPAIQWVVTNPDVAGSAVLRIDSQVVGSAFTSIPTPVTPPTPSFDATVSPSGQHFFLAAISGGELFVWRRFHTAGSWSLVDGVNGNQSFQTCTPANPELALTEDNGFFLVWVENCGSGLWTTRAARID